MEIIMPEIGVIFWTIIAFLIVWFILRKFAWKPILKMLEERNHYINEAMHSADKAREEMKEMEARNNELVKEAKLERENLLREARDTQDKIISEARESAKKEASQMIEKARKEISAERESAFAEMKNEIVNYSVEIAEKVLRKEFDNKNTQKEVAERYINDIKTN
ncbi:F0F1 ATP synthase subunit B [Salinivirga cyanobacteriivorans]